MSITVRRRGLIWTLIAITSIVGLATAAFAGSSSTTLPRGADLSVSIDNPLTSTEFLIPTGDAGRDVTVSGTASVGLGEPDATFIYTMDVSGSTDTGSGTGCSPILDCERKFLVAFNNAVAASGEADEAGLVVYASSAASADMAPAAGDQMITAPDAGPGDVTTVVNSTYSVFGGNGGVGQFTNKVVGVETNCTAALQSILTVKGASTNSVNIAVFVSDGLCDNSGGGGLGAFNAAIAALAAADTVVHTVAAGTGSSCTGAEPGFEGGTLQAIATGTGGQCFEVPDPGNLPDIIPDLIGTSLDSLGFAIDGGAEAPISNANIDPDLPQAGPASVTYSVVAQDLAPGDHELCTTAYGSDTLGSGSVTHCETIHMYQLTLAPNGVVNELGVDDSEHTVTADLLGPAAGLAPVGGRDILFSITSGPHADGDQTVTTAADGTAEYTYSVVVEPASLGTDTIQACVTLNDPMGETGCTSVTKVWQDTTPPVAQCVPTVNPAGETVPVAPGQGHKHQNPDGFYELLADDNVWPDEDLEVYVVDTGSGTVFGPFDVGTRIKYTEDMDATPEQKPIGGTNSAVQWHIIGNGDAQLYAVDGSGNVSATVDCLVPPPPS